MGEIKGRNNEIQVVSAVLRILERELWASEEWNCSLIVTAITIEKNYSTVPHLLPLKDNIAK